MTTQKQITETLMAASKAMALLDAASDTLHQAQNAVRCILPVDKESNDTLIALHYDLQNGTHPRRVRSDLDEEIARIMKMIED